VWISKEFPNSRWVTPKAWLSGMGKLLYGSGRQLFIERKQDRVERIERDSERFG
jgi:hypothetical protein